MRRKRIYGRRRGPSWWQRLVGAAAVLGFLWLAGLAGFIAALPTAADDPEASTDAIVVLTGGSDRLAEGLRLLAEGRARKLLVSGVPEGIELADLVAGLPDDTGAPEPAEFACCVALGHAADNTAGNAREAALWMAGEGFGSLRLVTADYHMPRSRLEFRRAMPGAVILGHAVYPAESLRSGWWHRPATLGLIVREYGKYLLALLRAPLGEAETAPAAT